MGFSCQRYLVAGDETIYRLAYTKFDRMLRDPVHHLMPLFAGQRVRTAEVIVELVGRVPVAVVRTTFAILTFDGEGRIVPSKLRRQQFALAELALAPGLATSRSTETVIDATSRFVAQGGPQRR
jgi:hypothetical protein